jgi:hypothetical protein
VECEAWLARRTENALLSVERALGSCVDLTKGDTVPFELKKLLECHGSQLISQVCRRDWQG